MKNAWLGYLSSLLLLLAGILQFVGGKILLGCLFTALAVIGVLIKIYMGRQQNDKQL